MAIYSTVEKVGVGMDNTDSALESREILSGLPRYQLVLH
jgi:hypothetical protein